MTARSAIRQAVPLATWSFGTMIVVSSMLVVVPASNAGEGAPTAAADTRSPSIRPGFAPGPLVVSAANPRYFTIGSGDAADGGWSI